MIHGQQFDLLFIVKNDCICCSYFISAKIYFDFGFKKTFSFLSRRDFSDKSTVDSTCGLKTSIE